MSVPTSQAPDSTNSIYVSNISPKASETTLRDFFSFCGTIAQLVLRPAPSTSASIPVSSTADDTSSQEAIVQFIDPNATKTALLLTNALILDRPINVIRYANQLTPTSTSSSTTASTSPRNETSSPSDSQYSASSDLPVRSATATISSLLAAGYTLGANAAQKAKELDIQYGVSANLKQTSDAVAAKAAKVDQDYKVSETTKSWTAAAYEKWNQLNTTYGVTDTVSAIGASAADAYNKVAESDTVKATVGALNTTGSAIKSYTAEKSAAASKALEESETAKIASEKLKTTTEAVKQEWNQVVTETNKKIVENQQVTTGQTNNENANVDISQIEEEQRRQPPVINPKYQDGGDEDPFASPIIPARSAQHATEANTTSTATNNNFGSLDSINSEDDNSFDESAIAGDSSSTNSTSNLTTTSVTGSNADTQHVGI